MRGSRGADRPHRLPHPRVHEVEVDVPARTCLGDLPAGADRPAVVRQRPGEALREVQRREVRARTAEGPRGVVEAHLVHPRDAPRIEVVLQVPAAAAGIGPDDGQAVRRLVDRDLPALEEERSARHPLEGGPAPQVARRPRRQRFDAPLADERREGCHLGGRSLLLHDCTSEVDNRCSASFRSSSERILALPVSDSSSSSKKSTRRGILYDATRPRRNRRTSSSSTEASSCATAHSTTISPSLSSGTPTASAALSRGYRSSVSSISIGETLAPPDLIMSVMRPVQCRNDSAPTYPASPVWKKPSSSEHSSGSFFTYPSMSVGPLAVISPIESTGSASPLSRSTIRTRLPGRIAP